MSLCCSFYSSGQLFVCADSRVSIKVNGLHYFVSDDYKKIRRFGNMIVFISGKVDTVERIFRMIRWNESIEQIQMKSKSVHSELGLEEKSYEEAGFVVEAFTFENDKPIHFSFNSNDFIINKNKRTEGSISAIGAHQTEAVANFLKLAQLHKASTLDAVVQSFEAVVDEAVGGTLFCFMLKNGEIIEGSVVLKDTKPLRKCMCREFKIHADMHGNLIANNANITGNINMTSGSISWSNVTKPTYNANEVGARPVTWTPTATEIGALATSSPMLTYIDSQGIYTGTIKANQIAAGKISAAYIDTTNLSAQKIYQQGYPNNYVVLGGTYGDLEMYYQGDKYFTIMNNIDNVTMSYMGRDYLSFSSSTGHAHPIGTWDFSGTSILGLSFVAKFG